MPNTKTHHTPQISPIPADLNAPGNKPAAETEIETQLAHAEIIAKKIAAVSRASVGKGVSIGTKMVCVKLTKDYLPAIEKAKTAKDLRAAVVPLKAYLATTIKQISEMQSIDEKLSSTVQTLTAASAHEPDATQKKE